MWVRRLQARTYARTHAKQYTHNHPHSHKGLSILDQQLRTAGRSSTDTGGFKTTYGRAETCLVERLIKLAHLRMRKKVKFVDLGSGLGNVVFQVRAKLILRTSHP